MTSVYPESTASIPSSNGSLIPGGVVSVPERFAVSDFPAARRSSDNAPSIRTDAPHRTNTRGGLAPWQRRKVIEHVEQNFASSIRIEDLASLAKLRPSHFSRAFKTSFNVSPYNYVIGRRLARAKHMMMQTDEPLSFIALECGMADQPHFCNLFRRFFGLTPSAWRRRQGPKVPFPTANDRAGDSQPIASRTATSRKDANPVLRSGQLGRRS